jgi:hypothetical protein
MMYLISVVMRLALSLTLGLPFFIIGGVLFLMLDILFPNSDKGYQALNLFFKWGSFYWFKGLRMETDSYDIAVSKQRSDQIGKT